MALRDYDGNPSREYANVIYEEFIAARSPHEINISGAQAGPT